MSKTDNLSRRDLFKAGGAVAVAAAATSLLPEKAEAAKKNPRWAMIVDIRKCVGCYSCQVSCKMENSVPMIGFNSKVDMVDRGNYPEAERIFIPKLCNHCEKPPCTEACPVDPIDAKFKGIKFKKRATYQRPDGAVLVDNERCIGCGQCIEECPYGARYFNPHLKPGSADRVGEQGIGKCTFCAHRIYAGLEPACVRNCVGKARFFGDLNDPKSAVSWLVKNNPVKVLKPEAKTEPYVYYIQLDKDAAGVEELMNPKP